MNHLLTIDPSVIDWSRAQFALTAIYHWLFVPLTLGLAVVMGIIETIYYRTGKPFWREAARFWQRLFGVNFAMGVATGIILEFEFGTNWSNYSWFVGDIFGAPLAVLRRAFVHGVDQKGQKVDAYGGAQHPPGQPACPEAPGQQPHPAQHQQVYQR